MQTTKEFRVVQSKCQECSTEFTFPILPEMSYGLFLFKSSNSRIYRYYDSNDNDVWSYVSRYLEKINQFEVIQYVLGYCMDKVDGQPLSITDKPVCNSCQKGQYNIIDDETLSFITLQSVSFNTFRSLDDLTKKSKIDDILETIRPQINQLKSEIVVNDTFDYEKLKKSLVYHYSLLLNEFSETSDNKNVYAVIIYIDETNGVIELFWNTIEAFQNTMNDYYENDSENSVKYSSGDFVYSTYNAAHEPTELDEFTTYYNDFRSLGADAEVDLRFQYLKGRVRSIIIEVAEILFKTNKSLKVTDDFIIAVEAENTIEHICNIDNLPIDKLVKYELLEYAIFRYKKNK